MYRIVGISGVSASLKTYIEIPVDSAVLYSALLVGMDYQFYAEKRLLPVYVRLVSSGITGIAPTLIIVGVIAGHARPDDSWIHPHIYSVSLRFASAQLRRPPRARRRDIP
ncbi:hypothetical protein CPB85DRAFT_1260983 [Mucidula mucida]|nr:hypothetical protein CPB85DRAFT_1260983 [Mucidula mucida]